MKNIIKRGFVIGFTVSLILTGCSAKTQEKTKNTENKIVIKNEANNFNELILEDDIKQAQDTVKEDPVEITESVPDQADFSGSLFYYMKQLSENKNFMVSPTSLRAALCLAIEGAEGETLDQLLQAAAFESKEDAEDWYSKVSKSVKDFQEGLEKEKERIEKYKEDPYVEVGDGEPDRTYSIVNSIWNNTDKTSNFKDEYKTLVNEKFGATANDASAAEITDKVNNWCNEETNGMIPQISDDLSNCAAILANALYLRTTWIEEFYEGATHEGIFTAFDGSKQTTDFMKNQSDYSYYEDNNTQLVILPMDGNKIFVTVLGDDSNIIEKIKNSSLNEVIVTIPKMEIESTFSNDMINFIKDRGAVNAFDENIADFSQISNDPWYISDIIQKTKLKTDEKGIEAAAVTIMEMDEATSILAEEKPKEFTADKPFSFFIIDQIYLDKSNNNEPQEMKYEILFAGKYNSVE